MLACGQVQGDDLADPRKAPFRFWRFFFSLQGRVSRWPFLAFDLGTRLGLFASYQAVSHITNLSLVTRIAYTLPLTLVSLIVLWPNFALMFKRFHDAGFTGLWSLVYFTPSVYASYSVIAPLLALRRHEAITAHAFLPDARWLIIAFNYGLIAIAFLLPSRKTTNRYGPRPGNLPDPSTDVF